MAVQELTKRSAGELMPPPHAYGPEAIRNINGKFVCDINLGGNAVTLPLINVGKDKPNWVAYADVRQNVELAMAALPEMVSRIYTAIQNGASIDAIVTPQSDKSEAFIRSVTLELSRRLGRVIPLIQLVGSIDNPEFVKNKSAPGLTTECVSVVSKAKGITKTIGMTEKDAQILKAVDGRVAWVDDVLTTGTTREKSFYLINKALGKPEDTTYPTFVIAVESEWGPAYPKAFPEYNAIYQTPEFTTLIPDILRK